MSKKDKTLVALILALALAAGLVLVWQGLLRAEETQADYLESLLPTEEETPAEEPLPESESLLPPPAAAPEEEPEETETAEEAGEELLLPQETGPDLGNPPALAADEVSQEELVDWLVTESSGALEAQAAWKQEQALTADSDADRRSFAAQQAESNRQARENLLEETGTALAQEVLRCSALRDLAQSRVTWLEQLEKAVADWPEENKEIPAQTEVLEADQATLTAALEEARAALETAEAQLTAALEAVNTATGRPLTAALTLTGTLEKRAYAVPEEDTAAQAAGGRNELQAALWQITQAEKALTQLRYEAAPDSPELLAAEKELETAQAAYPQAVNQVEADVRGRCRELKQLEKDLPEAETFPEAAYALREAEEQQEGQPKAWVSNLTETLAARTALETGEAKRINDTARYNRLTAELEHALGVGIQTAVI